MKKTPDQKVNGAEIAAQILARMDGARKERLMEAIKSEDPEAYQKISENTVGFEQITDLTDRGIQALLQKVKHEDLVLSLKTAPKEVRDAIYRNMSERKVTLVEQDLSSLPPVPVSSVKEAQARITRILDDLRTAGAVTTKKIGDVWV